MNKEEIFARLQRVLIETFELEEASITLDAHLFDELDLDSFDAVDLAVTLEVDTGIKLQEDDMRAIRTIADVVDTIHKKMQQTNAIDN